MIKYIMFIFNSYLVITAQSWHIHFSLVNFCQHIVYNHVQQVLEKERDTQWPKNPSCSKYRKSDVEIILIRLIFSVVYSIFFQIDYSHYIFDLRKYLFIL